jgi:putative transposase
MIVTFQYRLYPTKEQQSVLDNTLETLRHLYNGALAERIDAFKHDGKTIGFVDQANQLPLLKETAQPLAELNAQVAQDCLKRLDKAYQAFFRRVKAERNPAFPVSRVSVGIAPSATPRGKAVSNCWRALSVFLK